MSDQKKKKNSPHTPNDDKLKVSSESQLSESQLNTKRVMVKILPEGFRVNVKIHRMHDGVAIQLSVLGIKT